tara:strand:- start:2222 stop:2659 length:438 start_codon:yes stop_codon:yes gene_type:complete
MVKPIDNTVLEMPSVVGGEKISTTFDNVIRMRFRDIMNMTKESYLEPNHKKHTVNTPHSKEMTKHYIKLLETAKAFYMGAMKIYKQPKNKVNLAPIHDCDAMLAKLKELHITPQQKAKMANDDLLKQMELLQQQIDANNAIISKK